MLQLRTRRRVRAVVGLGVGVIALTQVQSMNRGRRSSWTKNWLLNHDGPHLSPSVGFAIPLYYEAGHLNVASHLSRAKACRHLAVLGNGEKSPGHQVHDWDLPPGSGNHYFRDLFCHNSSPAE
ncbi:hypothetical protein AB205_0014300 [Aquarana catesbeiana]|uniref:Uncharacterized protein n=1 Tax=Aquarana catesbeiana TaxID=8400 RepID=A0A2G9QLN5_AQUCT|nr:hypothetical protein AB205_0014300 [Aquarana catesbeiana]